MENKPNLNIKLSKTGHVLAMRTNKGYSWMMNTENGYFMRYGKTFADDPNYSPIGPEILDIEINTDCNGINGVPCKWCYKSNTASGTYMPFENFIKIVNKINPYNNLTQVALGMGNVNTHPDFVKILNWCRKNDIVPNLTVNGAHLDEVYNGKTYAAWIAKYCGAVAVSHYNDDVCFNAVKKFTDLGMTQVNIHQILANETIDDCVRLVNIKKDGADNRLDKLNAIVFLSLKRKGNRNTLNPLDDNNIYKYNDMIQTAINHNVSIGFDSCGANRFLNSVKDDKNINMYKALAEPCEAACFSFYVNVDGKYFPCSFCEGECRNDIDWKDGINLLDNNIDFIHDLWYNDKVIEFRNTLINNNRNCPMFDV